MPYNLLPDGNGGWRAQYIPATGTLPGSVTGIKVDAAGNVITTSPEQFKELSVLTDGNIPVPAPAVPPPVNEAPFSPVEQGNFDLGRGRQKIAVERAAGASQPDDDMAFVNSMNTFAKIDNSVRDVNDPGIRPPATESERVRREQAARRLAASFGYTLAWCPSLSETFYASSGHGRHDIYACVANAGTWYEHTVFVDELQNIETALRDLANRRASKAQLDAERVRQMQQEKPLTARFLTEEQAHAESPAGQAELAGRRVAALEATVARLLAERDSGKARADA